MNIPLSRGGIMKKIQKLSFASFIFSVFALLYLVPSVSAQVDAHMNGGQSRLGAGQCDSNPACDPTSGTCCKDQCDPNPACVASDPNAMPCCNAGEMSPGGPNDHHSDQDAAHCRAMGMADGSPHVDPPQAILDQVQAEYEANCKSGNCFLGEGNYKLLEGMGHTRAKVDCFLAEGHRKHDEQHGGPGDGNHPPAP